MLTRRRLLAGLLSSLFAPLRVWAQPLPPSNLRINSMALSAKTGAFNIGLGAATTTVPVTGVGFTPKVVIFWWSGRTESVDTAGRATLVQGVGWATSATDSRSYATRSADAAAISATDSGHRADACVLEQGDGAMVGWADLQSFDADGFTLEILDAFVTDLRVSYLAMGGADLTNAASVLWNSAAGVVPFTQAVTGFGFQPDFVLNLAGNNFGNPPVTAANMQFSIGMASGSANRYATSHQARDGQADTNTGAYGIDSEFIAYPATANPTINARADFTSFDAGGFTITWSTAGSGFRNQTLGLKFGGNVAVGSLLTQTDTTTAITVSGLAFKPAAVLFLSHAKAESTTGTAQDHQQWSLGAATSATERTAQGTRDQDAAADSIVTTGLETDAVYMNLDGTGVVALMDLTAMNSDGFSAIMDDAEAAQTIVGYAAFGAAAAGAASVVTPRSFGLLGVGA